MRTGGDGQATAAWSRVENFHRRSIFQVVVERWNEVGDHLKLESYAMEIGLLWIRNLAGLSWISGTVKRTNVCPNLPRKKTKYVALNAKQQICGMKTLAARCL